MLLPLTWFVKAVASPESCTPDTLLTCCASHCLWACTNLIKLQVSACAAVDTHRHSCLQGQHCTKKLQQSDEGHKSASVGTCQIISCYGVLLHGE